MKREKGKVWVEKKGGVPEIVGIIAQVDKSLDGDTEKLARKFGRNVKGLEDIVNYVVANVKYQRDGAEKELIKYPARTLRDGVGDCKSMSVLIGSILKDKGVPYKYRFTYTDENNPLAWHVYPIARLNGKEYTMDAVVKKFNQEHPYVAKFDYEPKGIMAVSGVGATASNAVPPPNYIDTFQWTDGEITATLIYEQLNIISAFTPSPEITDAKTLIQDALFLGINDTAGLAKIKNIPLQEVRNTLIQANRRKNSIAGNFRKSAGISDPLIPLEDCTRYLTQGQGSGPMQPGDFGPGGSYSGNIQEYQRCQDQNRYKAMLNNSLEGSAHHLLYEYETNPNAAPATVAAKKVMHAGAIDALADITGLSRNNISLWLRNGVLRENARRGAGPLQPEGTIEALPQALEQGVGVLPVPVIVAIISAIAAAVAGTLQLIGQMKVAEQNRLRAAAQTIGLPNFGPLASDWETYQQYQQQVQSGGGATQSSNWLPIAAAAAGAYFLIK